MEQGIISDDTVDDCSTCNKKCVFSGKTYFSKYPKNLILQFEKFAFYQGQAVKL